MSTPTPKEVLNPAQKEVMEYGLLDTGFSVVLQMPTGTGKTWLASKAIHESIQSGYRAVYLSPLRALAEELSEKWTQLFDPFPVGIFTGDFGPNGKRTPVPFDKAKVLVMTPERLDACTRHWRSHWGWIPEVDLVVVDEIHLLGDPNRGARLEGAISRLRRLNPFVRFIGLSATIGNRGEIADWLQGVEFSSSWRSIPLHWRIERFKKAQEKPDLLTREAASISQQGHQSIVFVQSRRRCEALAHHLRAQGLIADYHHAGLGHEKRRAIETAFRENRTPVLIATGTLEMGLNLPARQVILYDLQGFSGHDFCPLSVSTVWQRAGRAGRPGFDTMGEAVLFAPAWDRQAEHYLRGKFEPIRSSLSEQAQFEEQILVEVQSGLARSEPQLIRAFNGSLAVAQGHTPPLEESIRSMTKAEMLELDEESDRFKVTPLGRVATRQMLRPATILQLQETLQKHPTPTFFDLLAGAALAEDCEPVLAVDFEDLESFADHLSTIRTNTFQEIEDLPYSGKRLLSAFKMAVALLEWMQSGNADAVAEEHGCYPFEISRLCESMDRLLMAMVAIHRIREGKLQSKDQGNNNSTSDSIRRIELLRQMVINGLPEETASLSFISGIGSKWARKLAGAGYTNLHSLSKARPRDLSLLGGLSLARTEEWIASAGEQAKEDPIGDQPQAASLSIHPLKWEFPVEPYRLRRSLELTVEKVSTGTYRVTGGLEPHSVNFSQNAYTCDCPDFQKGNTCKHLLAVRRIRGDRDLQKAIQQIESLSGEGYIDLIQLWFHR